MLATGGTDGRGLVGARGPEGVGACTSATKAEVNYYYKQCPETRFHS